MVHIGEFSVVIPTKNRQMLLSRAVHSVANNSLLPFEVIIINDAGTPIDESAFRAPNLTITIINLDKSKGANYCRNLGVESAQQEIIFFLDDDDALEPTAFQSRYDILAERPEVGLIYTGAKIVHANALNKTVRLLPPASDEVTYTKLLAHGNLIGSTSRIAIRKAPFYISGGFDESLNCLQDYDLYLRMSQITHITHDHEANLIYTLHSNSTQKSSQFLEYEKAALAIEKKNHLSLKQYGLDNHYLSHCYQRCAISAANVNWFYKVKYATKALTYKINLKSIALLFIPISILSKLRPFV